MSPRSAEKTVWEVVDGRGGSVGRTGCLWSVTSRHETAQSLGPHMAALLLSSPGTQGTDST